MSNNELLRDQTAGTLMEVEIVSLCAQHVFSNNSSL